METKLSIITLVAMALITSAPLRAAGSIATGQEKSALCQGCHGENGNSIGPEFPSLAGQQISYIVKQLKDFQSAKRQNDTMQGMAADLSEEDMYDIAAYFNAQKIEPQAPTADPSVIALGERLFQKGKSSDGIVACRGCHQAKAQGASASVFPALVGQRPEYTIAQLKNFRASQRANDPVRYMRHQAEKLSDEQIDALAAYLSSLGAP